MVEHSLHLYELIILEMSWMIHCFNHCLSYHVLCGLLNHRIPIYALSLGEQNESHAWLLSYMFEWWILYSNLIRIPCFIGRLSWLKIWLNVWLRIAWTIGILGVWNIWSDRWMDYSCYTLLSCRLKLFKISMSQGTLLNFKNVSPLFDMTKGEKLVICS